MHFTLSTIGAAVVLACAGNALAQEDTLIDAIRYSTDSNNCEKVPSGVSYEVTSIPAYCIQTGGFHNASSPVGPPSSVNVLNDYGCDVLLFQDTKCTVFHEPPVIPRGDRSCYADVFAVEFVNCPPDLYVSE